MDFDEKNDKYIIWLYGVNYKELAAIQSGLPSELFEIKDIMDDQIELENIEKKKIFQRPDLLICDSSTNISDKLKGKLAKSCCSIARVTTKKKNMVNPLNLSSLYDDEIIYELTDEEINEETIIEGFAESKKTTKLKHSLEKIKTLCQMSNFKKMQEIIRLDTKKEFENANISSDLDSGKDIEKITRTYLFKLANRLNAYITFKDNYTSGHCERVTTYSEALAISLGMSDKDVENISLGARLHDIGKIALPDAIINKTSRLSDEEFELMKNHTRLGAALLPKLHFGDIAGAVKFHHEKYDGSGYPDHLKGDEIPIYAQIIAIADSFDAMTSQRSYNNVKSADDAFKDLIAHKGTWYNPVLVDKFVEIIKKSDTIMENLRKAKEIADRNIKMMEQKNEIKSEKDEKYKNLQLIKRGDD